jgi:RND family efflux transporter MFP subunit
MPSRRVAVLAAATIWASIGTVILPACGQTAAKASLPDPGASARAVRIGKPPTRLETGLARATGAVRAREEAMLAAKASGQILRMRVEVGDRVRAGQPLVEMDPAMASIAVENGRAMVRLAEANLAAAELELKRGQALYDGQVTPDATLDRVKTGRELAAAQLDQARAGLRMAEQGLHDTVIVAPFAGVVTGRFKNSGDSVTSMPVTPLVMVTDVDHLEVRVSVPEGLAPFVQPGQKVSGVTAPGEQRFDAKVRVKNAVVDTSSRTVEVLCDVVGVVGPPLRPGTLVNIDFGGFGDKDGLFLPSSAVLADGRDLFVFVLESGKAQRRTIRGAPINPGVWAVQGGIDPTSDVILDPGSLAAGDPVVALADEARRAGTAGAREPR